MSISMVLFVLVLFLVGILLPSNLKSLFMAPASEVDRAAWDFALDSMIDGVISEIRAEKNVPPVRPDPEERCVDRKREAVASLEPSDVG